MPSIETLTYSELKADEAQAHRKAVKAYFAALEKPKTKGLHKKRKRSEKGEGGYIMVRSCFCGLATMGGRCVGWRLNGH